MRKAISLLLALCMALVLCACGSGKQTQSYPTANNGIGFSADKSVEDIEIEGVTQESPATSESVLCDLGDTISTGTLELTVSSAEFCEAVRAGSHLSMGAPGDDMILGCFEITVKNVGKELFNVLDYLDAKIDYNDGYTYSTKDSPSYLFDKSYMLDFVTFFFEGDRMGGSGNFVNISPLSSKEYILAIPCASALAEDETSPLKVIFTLPVDGVDKEFVYVIR